MKKTKSKSQCKGNNLLIFRITQIKNIVIPGNISSPRIIVIHPDGMGSEQKGEECANYAQNRYVYGISK